MPEGWQLWVDDERPTWRVWIAEHKKTTWALAVLGGLFLLVGLGNAVGGPPPETDQAAADRGVGTSSTQTAAAEQQPSTRTAQDKGAPAAVPAEAKQAVVQRIVDGDTLELAAVAAGTVLGSTARVDVRLLEIDAPETKHPGQSEQCFGEEASKHLTELAPPGSTVWFQRDKELKDQYGRFLLYLWNEQGRFVNQAMVADGYAKATLYMPNDRYWPRINGANSRARQAGTGFWGGCNYFGEPESTPAPEPEPRPEPEPQPEPEPRVEPQLKPQPEPEPARSCAPGYSPCVPPYPPDVDCGDVNGPISVTGSDPHGLDGNDDGEGCE